MDKMGRAPHLPRIGPETSVDYVICEEFGSFFEASFLGVGLKGKAPLSELKGKKTAHNRLVLPHSASGSQSRQKGLVLFLFPAQMSPSFHHGVGLHSPRV